MRNRLLVLVGAFVISLFSLNVASVQAQSSTVTTSATFSDMLSTFPQAVLSTINSVVLQSTNASSATTPFDSTARKDNLALQMGMWQSGRVGAGVKYWLSELTALRLGIQADFGAGVSGGGDVIGNNVSQRNQNDTGQAPSSRVNVTEIRITPSVNVNIGLSAAIEKHLFTKRNLSPYIGFGCGISIVSENYTVLTSRYVDGLDTGNAGGNRYFFIGGDYLYIAGNGKSQGTLNTQFVVTRTSVALSAYILVGAEYFILPSLSITAEASVQGGITGRVNVEGNFEQGQSRYEPNKSGYNYSSGNTNYRNIYDTLKPGVSVSAGVGFSSSLTLSLYFGRNVLGDIVNAFTSGTLFQW